MSASGSPLPLDTKRDELLGKYLWEPSSWPLKTLPSDVRGWTPQIAFYVIYRIWRDTIIKTFNLPDGFKPRFEQSPKSIRILAECTKQNPSKNMGLIEYHKKSGRVVLLNVSPPSHLQPVPPRRDKTCPGKYELVGIHKEARNRAVLAMALEGYRIHIETKYSVWDLRFKNPAHEYLSCFSKATDKYHEDPEASLTLGAEELDLKDEAYLCVKICPFVSSKSRKVELSIFMEWLGVVFDIRGLSEAWRLCETPAGDIMLEDKLAGKVYRDGLLDLRFTSLQRTFRYRYNLPRGLADSGEGRDPTAPDVDKCLAAIWKEAINQGESIFLPVYVEMLCETPSYRDVAQADKHVDSATTKKIWRFLRSGAGVRRFFYWGRQEEDVERIIRSFGKEPKAISEVLWKILRSASLIRTPEEEQVKQFRTAPETLRADSAFSRNLRLLIDACFKLDKETENIKVVFVDCGKSLVSVHYENDLLKINSKWLDYNVIHQEYPCRISSSKNNEPDNYFYCDHIVEQLYKQSLQQICTVTNPFSDKIRWEEMSHTVHEKLEEMPRRVKIKKYPKLNGETIFVGWELELSARVLSHLGEALQYCVILHDDHCTSKSSQIIFRGSRSKAHLCKTCTDGFGDEIPGFHTGLCGCQMRLVTPASPKCSATFLISGSSDNYYPMVARNESVAICGLAVETTALRNSQKHACGHSDEHFPWPSPIDIEYEGEWRTWKAGDFTTLFHSFNPEEGPNREVTARSFMALNSSRLRETFEIDEFLCVSMRGSYPLNSELHYILHIHSIFPPNPNQPGDEGTLLATRYSYLDEIIGLGGDEYPGIIDENEAILHFKDFNSMGSRYDASVIPIEMIRKAWPTDMRHTVDVPDDLGPSELYCRFAVRSDGSDDTVCLMPLASHLLPRAKRWPRPRYDKDLKPKVIGLTPGILGLSEGFCQAQCDVHSGFDYSTYQHLAWRSANEVTEIYDGKMDGIIEDTNSQKLLELDNIPQGTPIIATMSIPDKGIAQRQKQTTEDVKILQNIEGLLSLSPRPDFLVITCPIWVFHGEAHNHFCDAIHDLLQHRYSVHMKKINFRSHGIARDETILALIASSVCSPVRWTETFDQDIKTSALEKIKDLDFSNPMIGTSLDDEHPSAKADVYNHTTGLRISHPKPRPLGDAIDMTGLHRIVHPVRGDHLTVRELARIQGFDDEFEFSGCIHRQYEDVMSAFPPPIARRLAETVLALIRDYHCSGGSSEENKDGPRGKKRRRDHDD